MVQPIGATWFETVLNHQPGLVPAPGPVQRAIRFRSGSRPGDTITLSRAALRLIDQSARLRRMHSENAQEEFQ